MTRKRLGIGFIGSGFITRFHIRSLLGVRDADVARLLEPERRACRVGGGARPRARRGGGTRVPVHRGDGLRSGGRRRVAVRPEPRAAGEPGGDLRRRAVRRHAPRRRLRETARRAQWPRRSACWRSPRRRASGTATWRTRFSAPPVTRGRELIWRRGAAPDRPSLPGARRRGAQRPPQPVVLARRPAGGAVC